MPRDRTALIGHTGFVGSNLARAERFDDHFRSTTIASIRGRSYARIVCAGLPAAKWIANRDPAADRQNVDTLIEHLRAVEADEFVLISTVDVYAQPVGVDELTPAGNGHPYGAHRLALEEFVGDRFATAYVVRLPALFGPGLKKNVLFDLLNDNMIESINAASEFQWYDVSDLHEDLRTIRDRGLGLVNLVTEPIATAAILERAFPDLRVGAAAADPVAYDVRTRHAAAFGGSGAYIRDAQFALDRIVRFVAGVRAGRVTCG